MIYALDCSNIRLCIELSSWAEYHGERAVNNLTVDPLTVAELYRERWMVELFFKWVKQHLHVKKLYGTTENAVNLQLWIVVCDYLLLIIAKKKFCLPQAFHTISNAIGPFYSKK